jgi:DNA-binding transcriptional LysR family regulator
MIRLTIRQMEYFEALAETEHFGRAAELAGVSQPALSAQIAEMEARLSCRLFERGKRGVRLTEEARMLRPRIARILSEIRELEAAARRERRALEGRFRLGIIPTVAPYLLPAEVANAFYQRVVRGELLAEAALGLMREFLEVEIRLVEPEGLHVRAIELASELRVGAAYDTLYLALALEMDCELWTADQRFQRVAAQMYSNVRWLGEVPGRTCRALRMPRR